MDGYRVDESCVPLGGFKIVALLCVLLVVSLFSNVWQYGVIQGQRSSNIAPTAATAQTEITGQPVELKRKQNKVKADKRFDQLYKELENLSRLNDQMDKPSLYPRDFSQTTNSSITPAAAH